ASVDRLTDQLETRLEGLRNNRQITWQLVRLALGLAFHELLDDAVFQRVEADHHQAATHLEGFQRSLEAALEITEFVVDVDTDALKRPSGRILALFPGGIGIGQHFCQIRSAGEWLFGATLHNGTRHTFGKTLLAVILHHTGDFVFGSRGDPVRRTHTGIRIHAHMQCAVLEETEAALRVIPMRRRNAEIQKDAGDLPGNAAENGLVAKFRKTALHNDKAAVFGRQCFPGSYCQGILVESQQPSTWSEFLQDQPAVPATPEGAIHIATVSAHGEPLDGLVEQHGDMAQGIGHGHRIRLRSSSERAPGCLMAARSFAAWSFQVCSSHNWNLFRWPTSIACLSSLTCSRRRGGIRMRALPSISRSTALPTSRRCRIRFFSSREASTLSFSSIRSHSTRG